MNPKAFSQTSERIEDYRGRNECYMGMYGPLRVKNMEIGGSPLVELINYLWNFRIRERKANRKG